MNTISIIKYLFSAIGLGLLCGALFLFQNTRSFIESASVAEGRVVELVRSRTSDSTTYRPVVEFNTANGELIEFTSTSGSNPPSYARGETVKVFYRATDPQRARIDGFFSLWGMSTIFGGLGAVFFLIGGGIILFTFLGNRKTEYLKTHGTPITTKFQSIELNRSLRVGGRSPYRVITQWQNPRTSEIHVFSSKNLWFDPTGYMDRENIRVFIERDNPKKYFVDLSFLPRLAK